MVQLTQKLKESILGIKNPVLRIRWERFFNVPENLQRGIFDPDTADKVGDIIHEKYGLQYKDITSVAKIIGLIFLGEMPIKNFILALRDELNIDNQTAQLIAQDINQAIFQPVRESLMKVHGLSTQENRIQKIENRNTKISTPSTPTTPLDRPSNPFTVKPAHYTTRPNNIIDLREIKRKNRSKYNGFFTS